MLIKGPCSVRNSKLDKDLFSSLKPDKLAQKGFIERCLVSIGPGSSRIKF